MDKIKAVLFFVVIIGVVIYVFHSGVIGSLGHQFQSLIHSSSSSSGGFFTSLGGGSGSRPVTATSSSGVTPSATSTVATVATSTIRPGDVPAGFTVDQLSPYFHKVRFGGMSPGSFGHYGTITVHANLNKGESLDITGWQIKANRGDEYIPQAIGLYDPSGLAAASDIFLQNGQSVYLYSSRGYFNIHLNKCIGYIGNSNHTVPAFPNSCPYPDRSAITAFTGACQNFILSIGSCKTPNLNNTPVPGNDYNCRQYIQDNFNYRACFNAHSADKDFLSNQWWVWMGSSPIDQYHDRVALLDKSGLVVDVYTY